MNKVSSCLWALFYLIIFLVLLKVVGGIFGIQFEQRYTWFNIVFLGIPVVSLILHSFITLSISRSLLFMALAASIGTIMENIGLRDGVFFGGHYVYGPQLTLFTVPFSVILYWIVFIYTGYCVTNAFLYWLKKSKPTVKNKGIFLLIVTIILDSYFVTAIDLFMDPVAVQFGHWRWIEGGPYFGVPIGNFIGWFVVVIMVVGIFRTFEYVSPKKEGPFDKSIFVIPVLGYGVMSILFLIMSLSFNTTLAIIGSLFMMPQIVVNLILFKKYMEKQ